MVDLEQSGTPDPDIISTFSLITNFCLTKTKNRAKKSVTQLPYYCFE